MFIRDHIRSANAGICLGSIGAIVVGAVGLCFGAPFGMTALIAGGCVWAASGVVGMVFGKLNPQNTFKRLSFAAGLGAAAFCIYSVTAGPQAQQNRNRVLSETKALVAKFERAVGTPQPRYNNAPKPPAPVHADKDTGWIGVAPGGAKR
jgi:hypothetical protein